MASAETRIDLFVRFWANPKAVSDFCKHAAVARLNAGDRAVPVALQMNGSAKPAFRRLQRLCKVGLQCLDQAWGRRNRRRRAVMRSVAWARASKPVAISTMLAPRRAL